MISKYENKLEQQIKDMLDFCKNGGTPKYSDVNTLVNKAQNVQPKSMDWQSYRYQLNYLLSSISDINS